MNRLLLRLGRALVEVQCSTCRDLELIAAMFAPARCQGVPAEQPWARVAVTEDQVIALEGPQVASGRDISPPMEAEWLLTRYALTFEPGVALHAACVFVGARPVIFAAPSGSGKSTMSLAAVRQGAAYVTDDMVLINGDTLSGLARAIRFSRVPLAAVSKFDFLEGMDVASYRVDELGEPAVVPLSSEPIETREFANLSQCPPAVVVRVSQGADDSLKPLSQLERAVILHEAAIVRYREYDGSLGPGPTFDLVWNDPEKSFELLAEQLEGLS